MYFVGFNRQSRQRKLDRHCSTSRPNQSNLHHRQSSSLRLLFSTTTNQQTMPELHSSTEITDQEVSGIARSVPSPPIPRQTKRRRGDAESTYLRPISHGPSMRPANLAPRLSLRCSTSSIGISSSCPRSGTSCMVRLPPPFRLRIFFVIPLPLIICWRSWTRCLFQQGNFRLHRPTGRSRS